MNYPLRHVSWDEIFCLSNKIYQSLQKQHILIDSVVPIFRGGVVLSMILGANLPSVTTAALHIQRSLSNHTNSGFGDAVFAGITNIPAVQGKTALITEDIVDSGQTLDFAIKHLKVYYPRKMYVASLYNFNTASYSHIICGEKMQDHCWIVFPWEEQF